MGRWDRAQGNGERELVKMRKPHGILMLLSSSLGKLTDINDRGGNPMSEPMELRGVDLVVIPAYQPSALLLDLVKDVTAP